MGDQSRNSWINKDLPQDVSSMTAYKDGYEDILNDRRDKSDLSYAMKARTDVPQYKYKHSRSATKLKEDVLGSDRVKYTIEKVATESGASLEEVQKEAVEILEEMGHNLNLRSVRFFAYFLIKIFKSLFRRVYVNEEGVQRLRNMIGEYPILLMPTHRSYMDFLLVSYIFYHYDLPLPVIAAAMDFKGMKFVGWLLRQCGAFYIRRSFGTDHLYWAIFTEYVQTQLRNGDQPLEFFVEGTRSRTAKSYVPRVGMLSASLEAYFKAEVPDVMIVPMSVSYDRILEESLYAYELLGIPKPKESTSGLFKARNILNEDFGCVHIYIDEAISIRQFSDGRIDRVKHALEPRYVNTLLPEEAALTRDLAYDIVRRQQQHMVVSSWALMAAVLMQSREGISLTQLVKEVEWLKRLGLNLGAYIDWPGNASSEAVVRHYLGLHPNLVQIVKSVGAGGVEEEVIELQVVRAAHVPVKDEVMVAAATHLMLASYRNQLLHVYVRPAIIALTVNSCTRDAMPLDEVYNKYTFLETILSRDFVFQPGETKKSFEASVLMLKHSGALHIEEGRVLIKKSINKFTTFLSQMFEPFLLGYWVLCQYLLSLPGDVHGRPLPSPPRAVARATQTLAVRMLQDSVLRHHELLSLDMLANGLNAIGDMGALYRDKREQESWVSPNNKVVGSIAAEIAKIIEVPQFNVQHYRSKGVVLSTGAKL